MRWEVKVLWAGILLVTVLLIGGCGGSNDQSVFQNVFDRGTWNPTGSRLSFESIGGNGLFYIYSIDANGGNLVLLTPTDNDDDLSDEGGKMPAWSPVAANNELAMVARRGTGGQALFLINPTNPSMTAIRLTDDTVPGADSQPSWSPDGNTILYVSNKGGSGRFTIWAVNRDGTNAREIYDPINTLRSVAKLRMPENIDAQWPVYSPDGTRIAFQFGIPQDSTTDTFIVVINADGTNPVALGENNGFRDDAPWFSPDGTRIAFHSNRSGDFDIWTMDTPAVPVLAQAGETNLVQLTSDSRSDGFPVWSPAVNRIAFTRDRELWSMNADGTNQDQLTRRF